MSDRLTASSSEDQTTCIYIDFDHRAACGSSMIGVNMSKLEQLIKHQQISFQRVQVSLERLLKQSEMRR